MEYAHCLAPNVAVLALQAVKALLTCTLASGYRRDYCGVAV